MRESKSDVWICVATIVLFLYCFFIVGGTYVFWHEGDFDSGVRHHEGTREGLILAGHGNYPDLKGIEYPTLIFLAPLVFFMFFTFIVFRKELRDMTIWGFLFSLMVAWKILRNIIVRV